MMDSGKRPPLDEQKSLWEASLAAEGFTTGAGAATGDSFIDAGLIGAGANSFISMLAVIYPGQPANVDSMDITAFNNVTGEVTLAKAYKGVAAAIPVGVPYKIVTFRFVPAEVAALAAAVAIIDGFHDIPGVDAVTDAQMRDVIGGKADTAIYSAAFNVSSIIRYLKGLMAASITAWGTADAGSGAGLIRDAARTEIDDWWNGQTILMLTGAAAFQKRPITDFLAVTDDIIVAPNFDQAVGAGDIYIILAHYNMIVPRAADDVANALTSQVIGRKDDTALYTAAANATLMRYVKGLITAGIAIQGAVSDAGPAITDFDTNLAEATDDHYNGMLLMFIDGPNAGQAHTINDYAGGAKNVSFRTGDQWTDVPVDANTFVILPSSALVLLTALDTIVTETGPRIMGRAQIAATTIDLNQGIASYTLFTGTTEDVELEALVIRMPDIICDGALTSISIQTNDTTPQIFITAAQGAVANLVAEAQLSWAPAGGITLIKSGTLIQLSIAGGAHGAAYVCDVIAVYRAVVTGGYLA